jgi:hypothetical protein
MVGLLHDAAQANIGDVISPDKKKMTDCESLAYKTILPRPQRKRVSHSLNSNSGDTVRDGAATCASSGAGIRTPDTRIMIPLL